MQIIDHRAELSEDESRLTNCGRAVMLRKLNERLWLPMIKLNSDIHTYKRTEALAPFGRTIYVGDQLKAAERNLHTVVGVATMVMAHEVELFLATQTEAEQNAI